jgi:CheY-like chemotaxis protein/tRNA A-37 threonylcarbamoyl transferase component Bud32
MSSNARILVVDDEPAAVALMEDFLSGLGYQVVTAGNGVEAMTAMAAQPISLVVTDIDMPHKSGTVLLRELKALDPELPIILVTGKPSIDTAVTSMKLGAVDYLTKPFDLHRLRELVQRALPPETPVERTLLMPLETPERCINGFVLRRQISEGNMGVIYLAERDHQRYALKLIRDIRGTEAHRRELLERFIREAEVASRIDHPNVVRIADYGMDEAGEPYLVMEFIDGLPLHVWSKKLPLEDYPTRVRLLRQVALALVAIHGQGICHRDVKPANILVDDQLHAKLTDFGVARVPESDLTMADQILGSPLYMAPESYRSALVDHRADLFSLGIVCYEFLLGKLPFEGNSLTQIATRICEDRPAQPRRLDRQFPLKLQAMLADMLKKQPEARYQSAAAIAADFDEYLSTAPKWHDTVKTITQTVLFQQDWR